MKPNNKMIVGTVLTTGFDEVTNTYFPTLEFVGKHGNFYGIVRNYPSKIQKGDRLYVRLLERANIHDRLNVYEVVNLRCCFSIEAARKYLSSFKRTKK